MTEISNIISLLNHSSYRKHSRENDNMQIFKKCSPIDNATHWIFQFLSDSNMLLVPVLYLYTRVQCTECDVYSSNIKCVLICRLTAHFVHLCALQLDDKFKKPIKHSE